MIGDVYLPRMVLLERRSWQPAVDDPAAASRAETARILATAARPPGPVAVAVGSRGLTHLQTIVKAAVGSLRDAGWSPFIVPAMGSHGGSSAEGQVAVLHGLGISESSVGAPVRASMDVVDIGVVDADGGVHAFVDRFAFDAGAIFLVNRVKPHTDFHGPIESGPAKLLAVGLGHQRGAKELHAGGPAGLRAAIPAVARHLATSGLVLGALATVENEIGEVSAIQGMKAGEIGTSSEASLLDRARAMMPSIPFDELDVLVIERMGKDISGEGADPNVIGRMYISGEEEPPRPQIACIAALSLTDAAEGNALGIGLIDVVSRRLLDEVDFTSLYTNALTAGIVDIRRAKVPLVARTDRLAIQAAIACCGRRLSEEIRMCWIRDTKHVRTIAASLSLLDDRRCLDEFDAPGKPFDLRFDADDRLISIETVTIQTKGASP